MVAVAATNRSTRTKNMDETWNEHVRTKIANFVNVYKKETGGSAEEEMIEGSAKPF